MATYGELSQRLRQYTSLECGPGASEVDIAAAQRTLDVTLPHGYVCFLREFGWIRVLYNQLYGVGKDVPAHLLLTRVTADERNEFEPHLPAQLVPVMNDGAGNHYCLDTGEMKDNECPVVFWDHEDPAGPRQVPQVVGPNFVDWLWSQLDDWEQTVG